jgi:ATP-dependent Lon protease
MVVTISAETPEARAATAAADRAGAQLLLVPKTPDGRYARIGTIAHIEDRGKLPGGNTALVVRATARATVGQGILGDTAALWVKAEPIEEPDEAPAQAVELATELRAALRALFETLGGNRLAAELRGVDHPGALADMAGWWPDLSFERKVELLETVDVTERVELVLGWVKEALAEAELSEKIRNEVTEGMERTQREFLLRQQMQAIRKELGEDDAEEDLVQEYRQKLVDLREQGHVGDKTAEAIEREIGRFERTPAQNIEHGWIRDWLDTVFEVPWAERSSESLDVDDARRILDEDHTGLDEVKERIVEFLAVRQLVNKPKGPILCFVGPPGVGKTSLAKSIARATNRKFVRLSLGGVRDEAEIRGHRRTYIGAFPGQIIQMMKKAGSRNPVFLLDEVDKMSMDFRGDPSAALLEVLDPEQNHSFTDHYLDVEFDLSSVFFIATANVLHTIPQPLQDRMEVLRLPGYTEREKVEIAKRHLIRKQIKSHGLQEKNLTFTDEALQEVIRRYTREAGVRNMEREISSILRKVARKVVMEGKGYAAEVGEADVNTYLGIPRYRKSRQEERNEIGIATGLAWTEVGGEILPIEVMLMPGKGHLTLTGKLGDVMQESARAALSWVRSKAEEYGIDRDFNRRLDVHIHVPEGAIPKDGPSAGITIATALISALTKIAVRRDVAMTGEITLRGKVLPIGGVKEKLLAAHRIGITTIILPRENEKDLADVPKVVLDAMTVDLVEHVEEVLKIALVPPPAPQQPEAEAPAAAGLEGGVTDGLTH